MKKSLPKQNKHKNKNKNKTKNLRQTKTNKTPKPKQQTKQNKTKKQFKSPLVLTVSWTSLQDAPGGEPSKVGCLASSHFSKLLPAQQPDTYH